MPPTQRALARGAMIEAVLLGLHQRSVPPVHCTKLHRDNLYRCIFCGGNF